MPGSDYPLPTSIYHFTHVNNLPEILRSGRVYCQAELPQKARSVDISHFDLQDRRSKWRVGCGPKGTLHDYVPFYFAPRSPMMYVISRNNVQGYAGGTGPLVYLVSNVQKVREAGLNFVFTNGHPIKAITRYFDDADHLYHVDWDVMSSQHWNDTEEYPDRSRRRMAEFLVHRSFPWSEVEYVAVKSRALQRNVREIFNDFAPESDRKIGHAPKWYF